MKLCESTFCFAMHLGAVRSFLVWTWMRINSGESRRFMLFCQLPYMALGLDSCNFSLNTNISPNCCTKKTWNRGFWYTELLNRHQRFDKCFLSSNPSQNFTIPSEQSESKIQAWYKCAKLKYCYYPSQNSFFSHILCQITSFVAHFVILCFLSIPVYYFTENQSLPLTVATWDR